MRVESSNTVIPDIASKISALARVISISPVFAIG
jgi:hypothetical protein